MVAIIFSPTVYYTFISRVSQIADVFQKLIFESCTMYHIMPFAKIIGPVEKKILKVDFNRFFLDLNFEVFHP